MYGGIQAMGEQLAKLLKKPYIRSRNKQCQDKFSVIHKDDYIYQFLVAHPGYATEAAAREYYFATGRESVDRLRQLIEEYGTEPRNLLEFASGYGCVSRHFADVLPQVSVTACDIHPAAVEFISQHFGIPGILSTTIPERLQISKSFDVVFALSFFSHMPKKTWTGWLKALISTARLGGLIIFTTHGRSSWEMMGRPDLGEDGFSFFENSEQLDLDTTEYGTTITTIDFVHAQLNTIPDTSLLSVREGYWWGHQDVYVLRKVGVNQKEFPAVDCF